jgi:hypothetical protein
MSSHEEHKRRYARMAEIRRKEDQKKKRELEHAKQIRQRATELGLLNDSRYRISTVEELYQMTIDIESIPPHKLKLFAGHHRNIALHIGWLRNHKTCRKTLDEAELIVAAEWQISESMVHHCVLEHKDGLGNDVAVFVNDPDQSAVEDHFKRAASQFKKFAAELSTNFASQ